MDQKVYQFERFVVDQRKRQLFYADEPVFLSSKAFELLSVLIEHSGRIVEKETLFEKVWANSFVDESNLPVHISVLRRVFREKAAGVDFIKTVSGRGYSFVADVRPLSLPEKALAGDVQPPRPASSALAIAVLPFLHSGDDEEMAYLANGVTHSLIDDLSQIPNLKVLAFSAVKECLNRKLHLNDIGFLLGANRILTGEISEVRGKLEINVELIDAADQTHLWGTQQIFADDEIFRLRKEISLQIAERLKLRLTASSRETMAQNRLISRAAEKFYLRGKLVLESRGSAINIRETLSRALDYFERAIAAEPGYDAPYVGIGMTYVSLFNHYSNFAETYPKASRALHTALQLNDANSQAYVLKASIEVFFERNPRAASSSLDRAIELNRNNPDAYHWKGIIKMQLGEFDEALGMEAKAVELDPLSTRFSSQMMRIYFFSGQYRQAVAQAEQILEISPNRSDCSLFLAQSYAFLGNTEKSLEEIDKALLFRPIPEFMCCKAYLLARAGKRASAERLLDEVLATYDDDQIEHSEVAVALAELEEIDRAFEWIEKAFRKGSSNLNLLNIDPRFGNLRSDPRFKFYLEKLNLV